MDLRIGSWAPESAGALPWLLGLGLEGAELELELGMGLGLGLN